MLTHLVVTVLLKVACAFVYNNNTEKLNVTALKSEESGKSFMSACGDVFSKKQFVLESENYPSAYPQRSDCSYLIKGPYCPTYFQFQFLDFNIEKSPGCVKDRLEIENIDALCGIKTGIKNYFSKTGALQLHFKTDIGGSGRGYKILITRLPCDVNPEKNITDNKNTGAQQPIQPAIQPSVSNFIPNTPNLNPDNSYRQCCQTDYNTKNVLLVSPNFPYSLNVETDCIYKISRHNNNVCRLRIEVLLFNLGAQLYNQCPEGYMEIDGKIICGCKHNLKLISQFNEGEYYKIIRFKTAGLGRQFQTGFVLKVTQDECPKRYKPEGYSSKLNDSQPPHFINDQKNRVAWPQDDQKTLVNRLNLINERTEILDDNDDTYNTVNSNNVVKHFYYFAYPETNSNSYKDTEQTSYIYTININYILPDTNDFNHCLNWNNYQLTNLYSNYGEYNLKCRINSETNPNPTESNCIELGYERGYFKSPGYPFYYPGNVNLCYRFRKQSGYCAIRVYVNDFQLEPSQSCHRGYLSWANTQRYCGNSLHNTMSTFDVSNQNYLEAKFVTNQQNIYCGRGFFGVYEQLACQDTSYPINPVTPPYDYPTPTPPVQPTIPCDRIYQEENFVIEVYGYNLERCLMVIKKANRDTCKVILTLEKFDLVCQLGSLTIGGIVYCGQLTGKTVTINLEQGPQEIIYQRFSNPTTSNLLIKITGHQIQNSCPDLEVEPARIAIPKSIPHLKSNQSEIEDKHNETKFLFSLRSKKFKDICGIITNSTVPNLPSTLCDILVTMNNATKCQLVNEKTLYVPSGSKKIELNIENAEKTEEIVYQEIDCDNIKN